MVRPLASVVGESLLLLAGRASSSQLDGGEGMSSGAGLVLAEDRREEEGEGNDRMANPGGGDGERVRTVSSDSQSDGGSVSGELGPPLKIKGAIVKGRRVVCVFVAGVEVVDAFGSGDRGRRAAEGAATNNVRASGMPRQALQI